MGGTSTWPGGGSGVATYTNFAAFPASASDGTLALALDTDILYAYNAGTVAWVVVASPAAINITFSAVGSTPNSSGASASVQNITLQPASGTLPGVLTALAQTIGGVKTFLRNLSITNAIDNATAGNPTSITTGESNTIGLVVQGTNGIIPSAPNSTFFATYATTINATSSGGSGTGTASNGAAIAASVLNLVGGVVLKYVQYSATSNIDQTQVLTVRMNVIPSYSGSPATRQYFWCRTSGVSANGLLQLFHETDGTLNLSVLDSSGSTLGNPSFGSWNPTSGTTYELEMDIDLLNGFQRLFINGIQQGSTATDTGTSAVTSGVLRLGKTHDGSGDTNTSYANFSVSNFVVFPTVQHTSNFSSEIPRTYNPSQSADLQRWLSPSAATLAAVDAVGLGTFSNIIDSGLTASTVPYANASKQLASSAVTPTELGYVSGVTSAIQTQINTKGTATEAAEQSLGSLTWSSVADPTGTINKKYRWARVGNIVSLWCKIDAATAGTAVTAVDFALPGDMPNPAIFASQPNSTVIAYGSGQVSSSANPSISGAGDSKLYADGGGAFRVTVETTVSTTGVFAWCQLSYLA